MYQYQDMTAGQGHRTPTSHYKNYREENLMNANEIRTMKTEEVLIVSGNQDAVKIPSNGYYEVSRFKIATTLPSVPVEVDTARALEWVRL